ncbi:SH3 domain-containing protein [Candidatus Woesebacteria bacterium]|nr:SH3 domain-containing protein [Candidatus Woesebacteria bacterium]QQG47706.1 MAG: SH3 domain-containing protein [Candidatus Woesebacteria bacterium]
MLAKDLSSKSKENVYFHIHNNGIEDKIIFKDSKDYEIFIGYLRDYLSSPLDLQINKKVFKVKGRMYKGVPHLPKNYFDKVELIAYYLTPSEFHLILNQTIKKSIENFMRSLCTRYSMYFNKKYQRKGSLFAGPYKSSQITESKLLEFTCKLHSKDGYSSYPEYLGLRETAWIKPKITSAGGYEELVEKYKANEEKVESNDQKQLERRYLKRLGLKPLSRLAELFTATGVFFVLLFLGIRNIDASVHKNSTVSPTPISSQVLSESVKPTDSPKPRVIVKITDGVMSVNIRQKPSIQSDKIGEARDGDSFELISEHKGWFGIKLTDGSTGFISAIYIDIGEPN